MDRVNCRQCRPTLSVDISTNKRRYIGRVAVDTGRCLPISVSADTVVISTTLGRYIIDTVVRLTEVSERVDCTPKPVEGDMYRESLGEWGGGEENESKRPEQRGQQRVIFYCYNKEFLADFTTENKRKSVFVCRAFETYFGDLDRTITPVIFFFFFFKRDYFCHEKEQCVIF